jgi:hypothetical protein
VLVWSEAKDAEGEKLKLWCCANHTLDWTDVPRIARCAKLQSPNPSSLWAFLRLNPSIHLMERTGCCNYSENVCEEVKKGMREKASQGIFPGHAPFGYRNNKVERTIEADPVDSIIVKRIFELYATSSYTLTTSAKRIRIETGKTISRGTYIES